METGETFGVIDDRFQAGFYVRRDEVGRAADLAGARARLSEVAQTTMTGLPLSRVDVSARDQRQLADALSSAGIATYEADYNLDLQYLLQHHIQGALTISGSWQPGRGVDRRYRNPELTAGDWEPELQVLSLDLETSPDAGEIYGAALVQRQGGKEQAEMHLVGQPRADDASFVHCHPDESALLRAIVARVCELDPDIITGWNVSDFDVPVLARRCAALSVPLQMGRGREAVWHRPGSRWGGARIFVPGRQVLDALHLVRGTLQRYEDYSLETVAQTLLGRGKTELAFTGDRADRITAAYHGDRAAFAQYCLADARLVLDILEREGLIALTVRRSLLTGLPLARASSSIAAFEFLYLGELHRRGMVAPTTGVDRGPVGGAPGGLVMDATAGLFRHVFVFDFKSLYPSIMRTFNLDPLAHARAGRVADSAVLTAPNGARFAREPGILPGLLDRFWQRRAEARALGDATAAYAYKIIMNSFYGVLATPGCRFAAAEIAGAITGFGHYLLRWTRDWLEARGYAVLYGDTDSVFVHPAASAALEPAAAWALGKAIGAEVNAAIATHVRDRWRVASLLELEFEKYYPRFFLPQRRGEVAGRAKGYAGLLATESGARLDIVGMEAVRSDWTELAHRIQRELLQMIFTDVPVLEIEAWLADLVGAIRRGEHDGLLVYRKRLRKDVDSYVRTTPPHVKAARLMAQPSDIIRYVVTTRGPQPVETTTAALDYGHYIDKQIAPIVNSVGQAAGIDFGAALAGEQRLL